MVRVFAATLATSLLSFSALAEEPASTPAPASPASDAAPPPNAEPAPSAAPPTDKGTDDWTRSFGETLALLNVQTTWTGYGNFGLFSAPGEPVNFEASTFNPILVARMTEKISAEIELEIAPDGIGAEYLLVDYAPVDFLTLRAGKFLVPIGKFNEVLHPSFRWNMVSRPLMFREVVPGIWADTGLQLRGKHTLTRSVKVEWQAFAINGLQADAAAFSPDADSAASAEVLRASRPKGLADNNHDKAVGGRLLLLLFPGREAGATELGVSAVSGALDPAAAHRATLLDVDAQVALAGLTLRGEAAQSLLDRGGASASAFERGAYLQASWQAGDVNVAARWDWVLVRPGGGAPEHRRQVAVAASHAIARYLTLRGEVAIPLGVATKLPSFGLMLAFSF